MCTLIVTSVSRSSYVLPFFGAVLGWRVMFCTVGVLSMLVSYLVYRDLKDPLREKDNTPKMSWALVKEEWAILRKLLRNNTFVIIVLQGVFSGIPWNALSFMVMYFQFCGLSDPQAGLLVSLFVLACAIGGPLGGYIGDKAAQRYPDNGRAYAAQFSSLSGIPCMCVLLLVAPRFAGSGSHIHLLGFAQILIVMGLFCSWCSCAANRPILSEIVPERHRASILAWNIVLEGSAAAIFGAPLVGLLSEEVFGYVPVDVGVDIQSLAPEVQQKNIQALTFEKKHWIF